jgi:ABC-type branched-subunit amino acid transport system ATPase component
MKNYNLLFDLLDTNQKKYLFKIVVLIFFGMLFEILSIGLIFPILSFILNPDYFNKVFFLDYINSHYLIFDHKLNIVIFLIFISLIFFIKNIYLIFLANKQFQFIFDLRNALCKKFFLNYIHSQYNFFFKRNTSQIINNFNEISIFINNFLMPLTVVILEGFILIFLIFLILFYGTKLIFFLSLFIIFFILIFYKFTKNKNIKYGERRQFFEENVIKLIQQSFFGIKNIKIFNTEDFFFKIFFFNLLNSSKAQKKQLTMQQYPRIFIEFLFVIFFSIFISFFLYLNNTEVKEIIPMIGSFAVIAFRIIPAVNRIFISVQSIKYTQSSLSKLANELKNFQLIKFKEKPKNNNNFNKSIKIKNISFNYPDNSKTILKDLTLEINKGQKIGIQGMSGEGKTTLLDIILGLLKPSEGLLTIDDIPYNYDQFQLNSLVGYVPQEIYLLDDTIKNNIIYGRSSIANIDEKVNESLKKAGLLDFIESLPQKLETITGERGVRLSGGQRQRIAIARALLNNPDILVLDEATSALDLVTENKIMKQIGLLKNITVLIVTHRIQTLDDCDKIYKLENSQLKLFNR